jgi:hypothetical protein
MPKAPDHGLTARSTGDRPMAPSPTPADLWEDPRLRPGCIAVILVTSGLVAYNLSNQPLGALGWIAVFLWGMIGFFALVFLILSFDKPKT